MILETLIGHVLRAAGVLALAATAAGAGWGAAAWLDRRRKRRETASDADLMTALFRDSQFVEIIDHADEPEEAEPPPVVSLPPGRQMIAMPTERGHGPLGLPIVRTWSRPFPAHAQSAAWEDVHDFAPGCRPKRDPHFGMMGGDPPLSLTCPGCELEQTPLTGGARSCPYCGLKLRLFGSRVFFWREPVEVKAWEPGR